MLHCYLRRSDPFQKILPLKGNPDSVKFLREEIGIWENYTCGIRNPGLCDPEYRLRNPESH